MQPRSTSPRGIAATLLITFALALSLPLFFTPLAHAQDEPASTSPGLIASMLASAWEDTQTQARLDALTDDSRAGDFYFAQGGSGKCTITSVAMMARRAAFLDGADWEGVTLSSVMSDGWTSAGVKWNFSTAGYDIAVTDIDGSADSLARLLEDHPEGIAVYDPGVPHAMLLTDYDSETGTFYCADPANYYAGKRMPLVDSWNADVRGHDQVSVISGFSRAWVIQ